MCDVLHEDIYIYIGGGCTVCDVLHDDIYIYIYIGGGCTVRDVLCVTICQTCHTQCAGCSG